MRVLILLAALCACGDNLHPEQRDATPGDDAAVVDAPIDTPPQGLTSCLDQPTDLPLPPTGALPCEFLPPGFVAEVP